MDHMTRTREILGQLIAYPTVSAESNLALIEHLAGLLADAGARVEVFRDPSGGKANLFATIGPADLLVVYAALTHKNTRAERNAMALRGTVIAGVILLFFAIVLRNDGFLTTENLLNIVVQSAPVTIMTTLIRQ